jgi:hypothetical protein
MASRDLVLLMAGDHIAPGQEFATHMNVCRVHAEIGDLIVAVGGSAPHTPRDRTARRTSGQLAGGAPGRIVQGPPDISFTARLDFAGSRSLRQF